jgi:hypothetical protein
MSLLNRVNGLREKEIESLGYAAQMKAWNQGIFFVSLALICILLDLEHLLLSGISF